MPELFLYLFISTTPIYILIFKGSKYSILLKHDGDFIYASISGSVKAGAKTGNFPSDSKRAFAREVLTLLKKRYANEMHTALKHSNPWELLVATILSAQSQDSQVNKVTPSLFKRYKTIKSFADAKPRDLYRYVKSLGLYRSKAKSIVLSARSIMKRFGGKVPSNMEGLISLHGVGRKTANVVLSNAFGINSGIAIDTHCITVSNRLGFVHVRDPKKIEAVLMAEFPMREWGNVSHLFIALGRDVCRAQAKYCSRCVLKRICPSSTYRMHSKNPGNFYRAGISKT
jgi:endonuclease-3